MLTKLPMFVLREWGMEVILYLHHFSDLKNFLQYQIFYTTFLIWKISPDIKFFISLFHLKNFLQRQIFYSTSPT